MTLQIEYNQLLQKVVEMRESLQILKNPPKYAPPSGLLEPLDFLRAELSRCKTEADQARLIEQAEQALAASESKLAEMEARLKQSEMEFNAAAEELRPLAENLKALTSAYCQGLVEFHNKALTLRAKGAELGKSPYLHSPMINGLPWQEVFSVDEVVPGSGAFSLRGRKISDLLNQ